MARGKFKEWLTEDNLKRINAWVRDGLSDAQVAKNMGISKTTFYDWIGKYPAISDSVKKGKEPIDFEVENALLKRALGYDYEETKTIITLNAKGEREKKVIKTQKHISPDPTAAIFWLKNRQPEKWRKTTKIFEDKTKVEIGKLNAEMRKLEIEAKELENRSDLTEDAIFIVDEWNDENG